MKDVTLRDLFDYCSARADCDGESEGGLDGDYSICPFYNGEDCIIVEVRPFDWYLRPMEEACRRVPAEFKRTTTNTKTLVFNREEVNP